MMRTDAASHGLSARGWGNRVGFGARPALVVVDLTLAFTDPRTDLGSNCDAVLARANVLIAGFRKAGCPITFSTIAYDEPDARDSGIWREKIRGLSLLDAASKWVEQDPRLLRESGDPILRKKQASCFFETDFAASLRVQRIDTLVIAGCSTSGCVRATAVDGAQLGFRVIVAEDAVSDRLADAHTQSLVDIDLKYGDVMSVSEIVDHLATSSLSSKGASA